MSYSDLLKSPKWQKKRLEILNRDNWKCTECNDKENTLYVHHKKYLNNKKPWEYPNSNFITLCDKCHKRIHDIDDECTHFVLRENDVKTVGIISIKEGSFLYLIFKESDEMDLFNLNSVIDTEIINKIRDIVT